MAQWKLSAIRSLSLVGIAFIAYGFMMLDAYLNIWSFFSLDYSTHTAVSLGLIIFHYFNARRLAIVWIGSFILYLMLMLYQQYHTIADILVTGVVVGFPVWGSFFRGLIQKPLARYIGIYPAVLISAVLFGAAHYGMGRIDYALVATVAGIGYAYIYTITKSVGASILTHWVLNLVHFVFFTYPYVSMRSRQ